MKRFFITTAIVTSVLMVTSCNNSKNPLLEEWDTPFGIPPFSEVKIEHYKPAVMAAIEEHNKEIERALSTLTERERDIVKDFFGIGTQEMTLEEIGEKFGLTRERVRQIKEKAIRRLRHSNRSKLLKSYLG